MQTEGPHQEAQEPENEVENASQAASQNAQTQVPPLPFGAMGMPPFMMGPQMQIMLGQQQQNPEVAKQMIAFQIHDSDNRLKAQEGMDTRNHEFRMRVLWFVVFIIVLVFFFPIYALINGDLDFVKEAFEGYISKLLLVGLALLAGAKLPDYMK